MGIERVVGLFRVCIVCGFYLEGGGELSEGFRWRYRFFFLKYFFDY